MSDMELKEQYILYIDILGYQQKIRELGDLEFLRIIDSAYNETVDKLNILKIRDPYKYKIFSDNIMVCVKCSDSVSLTNIILLAQMLQGDFIRRGVFVRGSITKGLVYIDEKYVFGSGIIRAYHLENHISIYPRIIIDPDLINDIIGEIPFYIADIDGFYYCDYLSGFVSKEEPGSMNYKDKMELLTIHKTLLEKSLSSYLNNDRLMQKYEWCRTYHNYVCDKWDCVNLAVDADRKNRLMGEWLFFGETGTPNL